MSLCNGELASGRNGVLLRLCNGGLSSVRGSILLRLCNGGQPVEGMVYCCGCVMVG